MCENKDADQLHGSRQADQRLFRYTDSTLPCLFKSKIKFQASCHFLCLYSSVCVRPVGRPHCCFSHEAAQILHSEMLREQFANLLPHNFKVFSSIGFQCSNVRWITRKVFEHKAAGRVFKQLPSDRANV